LERGRPRGCPRPTTRKAVHVAGRPDRGAAVHRRPVWGAVAAVRLVAAAILDGRDRSRDGPVTAVGFSIPRDPTAVGGPSFDLTGPLGVRASIKGWPCTLFLHLGARATCAEFTSAQLRSSKLFLLPHGLSWDCV
jgi:hypothetical protein